MNVSRFAPASLLVIVAACTTPALGADFNISAHFGETYTNNARLTPFNEESHNIGAAALKGDLAA